VSNEREKELQRAEQDSSVYNPRSSSADLLDLVRSAEEQARLGLRKRTPAVSMQLSRGPSPPEEFVDVGDEAIDVPSSLPPRRTATPAASFAAARVPPRADDRQRASGSRERHARGGLPPAITIALLLSLAIGALVVVTR
jgi:hypothetical protein